jgi:hypothetical protein
MQQIHKNGNILNNFGEFRINLFTFNPCFVGYKKNDRLIGMRKMFKLEIGNSCQLKSHDVGRSQFFLASLLYEPTFNGLPFFGRIFTDMSITAFPLLVLFNNFIGIFFIPS